MKTAWEKYQGEKLSEVMDFSEGYKTFLTNSKTERETTACAIEIAEANGFVNFDKVDSLKAGDRVYVNNRDKGLCLYVIGEEDLAKGMNILGAHIDSPRIDIKQKPLYADHGLVLLDTHYYGGIKKYQWVAHPMALHGVVCKKDGSKVNVKIGDDANDPVVEISDLLVHLSADQLQKTGAKVIEGEDLNVLVGSIPAVIEEDEEKKEDAKEPVVQKILNILKE